MKKVRRKKTRRPGLLADSRPRIYTEILSIRLTPRELRALKRIARRKGDGASVFVRKLALRAITRAG